MTSYSISRYIAYIIIASSTTEIHITKPNKTAELWSQRSEPQLQSDELSAAHDLHIKELITCGLK